MTVADANLAWAYVVARANLCGCGEPAVANCPVSDLPVCRTCLSRESQDPPCKALDASAPGFSEVTDAR